MNTGRKQTHHATFWRVLVAVETDISVAVTSRLHVPQYRLLVTYNVCLSVLQLLVTYLAFCGMAISNALAIEAYTREYDRNKVTYPFHCHRPHRPLVKYTNRHVAVLLQGSALRLNDPVADP